VFVFINILGHPVELASFVQLCCRSGVDWKITQRSAVMRAFGQSRLLKVEVM
jgi:hypothetical protein